MLIWALMVRPVQKQLASSLKELPASAPALAALTDKLAGRAELAPAAMGALESDPESASLKRELNDLVLAEPASMTRTLQSWLRESKG